MALVQFLLFVASETPERVSQSEMLTEGSGQKRIMESKIPVLGYVLALEFK